MASTVFINLFKVTLMSSRSTSSLGLFCGLFRELYLDGRFCGLFCELYLDGRGRSGGLFSLLDILAMTGLQKGVCRVYVALEACFPFLIF